MNLKGLILAGGESKRAQTDKGLKVKESQTWVNLMVNKLIDLNIETFVSINPSQLDKYKNEVAEELLIIDDINIPGPLRGILSAHQKYQENNWLIIACDMIDMELSVMQELIDYSNKEIEYDFFVYKNEKYYQPFCGIYTSRGLSKLLQKHQADDLENYSMQKVFISGNTFALPVNINNPSFNNYNFPTP